MEEIVEKHNLKPHPEGGFYSVTYVCPDIFLYGEKKRSCGTCIYYILGELDFSCFHMIQSDEMWHHYEGRRINMNTQVVIWKFTSLKMENTK
jgi:uncharacterized protein